MYNKYFMHISVDINVSTLHFISHYIKIIIYSVNII